MKYVRYFSFFPFLIEEDGIEHSLYGNVVLVCIEKKKNDIIGCNSVVFKKCIDVFLLKKKRLIMPVAVFDAFGAEKQVARQ